MHHIHYDEEGASYTFLSFELPDFTIFNPFFNFTISIKTVPYSGTNSNYIEEIKETIQKPDKITDWSLDKNVRYYFKHYKNKDTPNYLMIIVKYLNGSGFIISTYFRNYIK